MKKKHLQKATSMALALAMSVSPMITPISVRAAKAPKLSKKSVVLVGNEDTYQLSVKNYKKKITWKTTNPKVAVVSNGKVIAMKAGTCSIKVKAGKKKLSCKVRVLTINEQAKNLQIGQTFTLKIAGKSGKVTWKSSNPNMATVSSSGVVKAVGNEQGFCTITGTANKKKLSCKIKVGDSGNTIKAKKAGATITEGNSHDLSTGRLFEITSKNETTPSVTYKSSNPNVFRIENGCILKAIKSGRATLTATLLSTGESASLEVLVKAKNDNGNTGGNPSSGKEDSTTATTTEATTEKPSNSKEPYAKFHVPGQEYNEIEATVGDTIDLKKYLDYNFDPKKYYLEFRPVTGAKYINITKDGILTVNHRVDTLLEVDLMKKDSLMLSGGYTISDSYIRFIVHDKDEPSSKEQIQSFIKNSHITSDMTTYEKWKAMGDYFDTISDNIPRSARSGSGAYFLSRGGDCIEGTLFARRVCDELGIKSFKRWAYEACSYTTTHYNLHVIDEKNNGTGFHIEASCQPGSVMLGPCSDSGSDDGDECSLETRKYWINGYSGVETDDDYDYWQKIHKMILDDYEEMKPTYEKVGFTG